jgi:PIN domain nuclease of toxin-antitoxin system
VTHKSGFLLDTHLIYWWMTEDAKLGKSLRRLIAHADVSVSVASVWEMVVKNAKGKLPLPRGSVSESLETYGFRVLPVSAAHAEETARIPPGHGDPFDRLLIAVARSVGLRFLTADSGLLAFAEDHGLAIVASGA